MNIFFGENPYPPLTSALDPDLEGASKFHGQQNELQEDSLGSFNLLGRDFITRELSQHLGAKDWFGGLGLTCKGFHTLTKNAKAIEQIASNMGIRWEEKSLKTIQSHFAFNTAVRIKALKKTLGLRGHEIFKEYEELVKLNKPLPNQFILAVKSLYAQTALKDFLGTSLIPDQIKALLDRNELTPYEIQILENHRTDRAILKLWKVLADTTQTALPFEMSDQLLKSINFVEQQASQFSNWCKKPEIISEFEKITCLKLNHTKLAFFPIELCSFINLESIELVSTRLWSLPSDFDKLDNLESLSIRYNCFTSAPSPIFKITSLTHLWLSSCHLTEIPDAISTLQNLTLLCLESNEITELSDGICKLNNLVHLNLNKNRLSKLPKNFDLLQNLKRLFLSENLFQQVPEQIFKLNLINFSIRNNNLKVFPLDWDQLTDLWELDIQEIGCSVPEGFKWPAKLEHIYQ